MNILTPGENKRLNELIGFLWLVGAVLVGLSLVSYSPLDPSLNTATPPQTPPAQNWIGITGAYLADLLLQALGSVAFLLPVLLLALAWQWFRSRPVESPRAKVAGVLLLLFSLASLLGLLTSLHKLWGVIPAGGLLGILLALGLTQLANVPGAFILTITCLVVGAYLATPFSFSRSTVWLRQRSGSAPVGSRPFLGSSSSSRGACSRSLSARSNCRRYSAAVSRASRRRLNRTDVAW